MPIKPPTLTQLREIAERLYLDLDDVDLRDFLPLIDGTLARYSLFDTEPDELPPTKYPRTSGWRPAADDNPCNAWQQQTAIPGAKRGPLKGRSIALKDNIMLAGVPMMNGASTLAGYVPEVDASVVTQVLDAGAEIAGKANCEYLCCSAASHTNATGPVHNPHMAGRTAGGSSSGCAALVASGAVDMAIGTDHGGSIRIPASFCGLVGLKPTHGLVPYTGIMPIDATLDHVGPITRDVGDNALLLEVLAGTDGWDPNQQPRRDEKYSRKLEANVQALRIGVVREGFAQPNSDLAVDKKILSGAREFANLGAVVEEVQLPLHRSAPTLFTAIFVEALTVSVMHGNGYGQQTTASYVTSLMRRHAQWRSQAHDLHEHTKLLMLLGEYLSKDYGGIYYAKAQNFRRRIRRAVDALFGQYDLLLMPTVPITAPKIPTENAPRSELVARALETIPNTPLFNLTGHPAISIPCGLVGKLPVGLMLAADYYNELGLYNAALAFEQQSDWRER